MTPKLPRLRPRLPDRPRNGRSRPPLFGRSGRQGGPRPGAAPDWTTPFPQERGAGPSGAPGADTPAARFRALARRAAALRPRVRWPKAPFRPGAAFPGAAFLRGGLPRAVRPRAVAAGALATARRFRAWLRSWVPKSPLLRAACLVLAFVTMAALAVEASKSALLDVDRIAITGSAEVPPDVALAAAGVQTGDPLFEVDTSEVRDRLEALPWVRSAKVTRDYPSKLAIALVERTAVAFLARPEGGFALLDSEARVLADRPDRPVGLPELMGVGVPPAPGAWLEGAGPALDAVAALPPELRAAVTRSTVADGSVTLVLGGREVRLGAPEQLAGKAATLVALLAQVGDRPLAYIDVRVPGAPVIGPLAPPPAPPASPSSPAEPAGTRPKD